MQIKTKIKHNRVDKFITIALDSSNKQIEFDNPHNRVDGNEHINPIIDHEIVRYKHNSGLTNETILNFNFHVSGDFVVGGGLSSNSYNSKFETIGFTIGDIILKSNSYLNSFFIMDIYDRFELQTRKKINSMYLTKIGDYEIISKRYPSGGYNMPETKYKLNKNNQLYYLNIPKYLLNETNQINNLMLYCEFSFYSGKTGKLVRFYKKEVYKPTQEDYIYEISLDMSKNTWKFNTSNNSIDFFQVNPNTLYSNKLNNTIEQGKILKENYPDGDSFDIETGSYSKE